MDSPHDAVQIWWPKDDGAFAPRRRDILRERHETVRGLIGANLTLPEEPGAEALVPVEELAAEGSIESAEQEFDQDRMYDAFRPVRDLVSGKAALVPAEVYEHMRASQAEVVACVSTVESPDAWAFFAVGSLGRDAPQWVFFSSPEAEPETDLGRIVDELRPRLRPTTRTAERDGRSEHLIKQFADRLRRTELMLLPVRRRRAIELLASALDAWSRAAANANDEGEARSLAELMSWLSLSSDERRQPYPDHRSVADSWLRLIRPRVQQALATRARRWRPWRLGDLLPSLVKEAIPAAQLWRAFERVPSLEPVDQRVSALIVGVPPRSDTPSKKEWEMLRASKR
jgi:hypothetical protein